MKLPFLTALTLATLNANDAPASRPPHPTENKGEKRKRHGKVKKNRDKAKAARQARKR